MRRFQGTMPDKMLILPGLVPFIVFVAGCNFTAAPPPEPEYAAICVDPANNTRVEDSHCGEYDDDGDGSSSYYFFMWSQTSGVHPVPAYGKSVIGYPGQRHFPVGKTTMTGLPGQGAPQMKTGVGQTIKSNPGIVRGGLGVKGGSSSGS